MTYDAASYWPERYRRQGPSYVAKGGSPESARAQVEEIAPWLRVALRPGRVLDFGCGPGRFRPVLEESGACKYVGVDLIPGLGTEPLGTHLPDKCDTAVAIMVLQHIVDGADYLHWTRQLYECLKPGGRVLVVDHEPMMDPDLHMLPRGPDGVRAAGAWKMVLLTSATDGHWYGVFGR